MSFGNRSKILYFQSLGIMICGFQGMGAAIALDIMQNMAHTQ